MKINGLSVVAVFALLSGCQRDRQVVAPPSVDQTVKPTWPERAIASMEVCHIVAMADYVVKAKPYKIGKPYKLELSPWPGEKFWATPVEWDILSTVLVSPLPGKQLPPLPSRIAVVMPSTFDDLAATRILGLSVVDGIYTTEKEVTFSEAGGKWSAPAVASKFNSEADVAQAFASAALAPACARVDVMGQTRAVNLQRQQAAPLPESQSTNVDAGP